MVCSGHRKGLLGLLDVTAALRRSMFETAADIQGGNVSIQGVASDRPFLGGYLQRQVKIELGARSDGWPAELRSLQPYIAKAFPEILKQSDCKITVLALERTFWEKATILHAESHRPPEKATPLRFSRHYYDLAMLADHPKGKEAVKRSDLRDRVVEHKQIFFPATWACYEQAVPGSIRLIPGETRLEFLRRDYRAMEEMFLGDPPSWKSIMERLQKLERELNRHRP